jgi:hypothetical protein
MDRALLVPDFTFLRGAENCLLNHNPRNKDPLADPLRKANTTMLFSSAVQPRGGCPWCGILWQAFIKELRSDKPNDDHWVLWRAKQPRLTPFFEPVFFFAMPFDSTVQIYTTGE